MTTFLLNPYDAKLDLTDKEDRKLYQEACQGLKEADRFSGKREEYTNFVKLIEKQLHDTRLMECLLTPTTWDVAATSIEDKKIPIEDDMVDIFRSHKATKDQVATYSDLV